VRLQQSLIEYLYHFRGSKKAILGLTVTLNEKDAKYSTIIVVAPEIPVKNCSKKNRFVILR
jgi:hypothetical protein